MNRIFAAAGIDYNQWKALVLVALKMDVRGTAIGSGMNAGHERRGSTLVFVVLFYMLMGAFASGLVVFIRDPLLSGTLLTTFLMFMVGMMVLVDHQSVITSPDDYVVLGFRPVSSRTYFAVRLTNVLVYTMALTTAFGLGPMLAYTFAHGFRPVMGLAAAFTFYMSTFFATLLLVLAYAWLLRIVGPSRLKRALSYLQLVMGFVVYGGYFAMSRSFNRRAMAQLALPDSPWLLLYPPTWFASILAVAGGDFRTDVVIRAALAVLAVAVLVAKIGGRLTLRYAEQLGALSSASDTRRRPRVVRRPIWFKLGEARAIALLIRGQLRNDQKFRMGVLGIMPLTVLYIFMSLQNGPLPDPFTVEVDRIADTMLINVAIMIFPVMLRQNLTRSDSYRASWIYFASPIDHTRVIAATRNVLTVVFLLPYMVFVSAVLIYFTGNPGHILTHMLMLGLISRLLLQLIFLIDPELPFSKPMVKGERSAQMFVTMFATMIIAFGVGPLLSLFVYPNPLRIVVAVALLLGASRVIDILTRVRLAGVTARLEFAA